MLAILGLGRGLGPEWAEGERIAGGSMDQNDTLIGRTLSNLSAAWREIAQSAARTVGRDGRISAGSDPESLKAFMSECLEARGGEISARMRAAELGETYLALDAEGRRRFLEILAGAFAVEEAALDTAIEDCRQAESPEAKLAAVRRLHQATLPPYVKLLTQFNALPEGIKFLINLRADLLALEDRAPALEGLDSDLRELLASWFDIGFLDLQRITWDAPAALLEKLIAYEAVHEIRSWGDLRHRLDSDRRLFALFHPRMPDEPLAFVEVALVEDLAGSIQALLDETAPAEPPKSFDTAIFYSISNSQKGLRGISFGDYLITQVVQRLTLELPRIKRFATLSPVPGFRPWLDACPAQVVEAALKEDGAEIKRFGGLENARNALQAVLAGDAWHREPEVSAALKAPLFRLCARYFLETRDDGQPIDPVARFHLKNGARLERLNWLGDTSDKGLLQSAGIMANYRYILADIEKNHEAYMHRGKLAMSAEIRGLTKIWR